MADKNYYQDKIALFLKTRHFYIPVKQFKEFPQMSFKKIMKEHDIRKLIPIYTYSELFSLLPTHLMYKNNLYKLLIRINRNKEVCKISYICRETGKYTDGLTAIYGNTLGCIYSVLSDLVRFVEYWRKHPNEHESGLKTLKLYSVHKDKDVFDKFWCDYF